MADRPSYRHVWYGTSRAGQSKTISAFTSREFPDASMVDLTGLAAGTLDSAQELWRAESDPATGRLTWVEVIAGGPRLWWVLVDEHDRETPTSSLVAFAADGTMVAPWTVLEDEAFARLDLDADAQVGAVRWDPATAQVVEIYVQPAWRRRRVGITLLCAADAALLASGSERRIWGGGDRTDMGEAFLNQLDADHRFMSRTSVVPPMTPGEH